MCEYFKTVFTSSRIINTFIDEYPHNLLSLSKSDLHREKIPLNIVVIFLFCFVLQKMTQFSEVSVVFTRSNEKGGGKDMTLLPIRLHVEMIPREREMQEKKKDKMRRLNLEYKKRNQIIFVCDIWSLSLYTP